MGETGPELFAWGPLVVKRTMPVMVTGVNAGSAPSPSMRHSVRMNT